MSNIAKEYTLLFLSRYSPAIIVFIGVIVAWQILVPFLNIPAFLLPTPKMILTRLLDPSINWYQNAYVTVYESLVGFALAVVVGVGIAVAMVLFRRISLIFYPFVIAAQVVPKIAFVPILFIWIGFNDEPRILTVFLVCFFPIVINTMTGLYSIESDMVDMIRSFSRRRVDLLVKAMFPLALPSFFSGLKVSITLALIGALVAEFVSSNSGLGFLIISAQVQLDTTLAFAAATLLIIIGFIMYIAIEVVEKLVIPWKPKAGSER